MGNDRVRELQETLYRAAKANAGRRFHALYDKLYRTDVLAEAWAKVRANGGSPGVDEKTIEETEREGVPQWLEGLARELKEKRYRPSPLRRVRVPKPNGGVRRLGVPTVRDRVVQTAAKLVMEPIFEADFEPNSYGFRPGKSAHDAVAEVVKWLNFGCEQVIDADIAACFDRLPKAKVMDAVERRVVDGAMLKLIRQWLDCGVQEGETIEHSDRGTPQGSPLSPLLANVYLDRLDKGWKDSGLTSRVGANAHLVRYADDMVILGTREAAKAKETLEGLLTELGLTLNEEKTRLVEAEEGFDFLGFRIQRRYDPRRGKRVTRWFPSAKSERRIRSRIHRMTEARAHSQGTLEDTVNGVLKVLRGWGEYARYSMASESLGTVWTYTFERLTRMYRRNRSQGRPRSRVIRRAGEELVRMRPAPNPYWWRESS